MALDRLVVIAFNHRAIKRIPANNNDARMNPTARSTAAIGVLRKTDIVASSFPCFSATCRPCNNTNIQALSIPFIGKF